MSYGEYAETLVTVQRGKREWPPGLKLILAFILGFLALSPAILGIHWERLLP